MADGRMGPVKTHAAQLGIFMYMFARANRDPKKPWTLRPDSFNPYADGQTGSRSRGIPLTRKVLRALARRLPRRSAKKTSTKETP
jgi:hypothetical protein